jgi:hypothetical protein
LFTEKSAKFGKESAKLRFKSPMPFERENYRWNIAQKGLKMFGGLDYIL